MELDRRTLPLNALRAFEAVGRHLNMSVAGEELGVTHGAVSHQVRALEEQLEVKLFDRAHKSLALTAAGQRLLMSVSESLERLLAGTRDLDPESLSGPISVACTPAIAANWLVRVIGEFSQTYPALQVSLRRLEPQQQEIPAGVDLALCYGEPQAGSRRVVKWLEESFVPVCNPALLHDNRAIRRPKDLLDYTLLHDDAGSWGRWLATVGEEGASAQRNLYFFDSSLAINAARQGYGIVLADTLEVSDDLRSGRLVPLLQQSVPAPHAYYLLTDPTHLQTRRARLLEQWLQEQVGYSG